MPAKEHAKQIGKHQYKYVQMTMTPALELLSLLSSFVGDALAPFAKGGIELDKELDPNIIAECVRSILARLGQTDVVIDIVGRLNKQGIVFVPGGKQLIDLDKHAEQHFGENFDELAGWLTFALGAQFGNFFGSLGGGKLLAVAKEKAIRAMKSPSTSANGGQSSASQPTSVSPTA